MKKIGVEGSLSHIHQALKEKGYDVIELKEESDASGCEACVVTGLDSNFMGIHTTSMQGPVIEASGLTAEEVCNEVANKLG